MTDEEAEETDEEAGETDEEAGETDEDVLLVTDADEEAEEDETADTAEETAADEPVIDEEATEVQEEEVLVPRPTVQVNYAYDGEMKAGTEVTVSATLNGFPEDIPLTFQWQNDANGDYQNVPGATGQSYTFTADEYNTDCLWRVSVSAGA